MSSLYDSLIRYTSPVYPGAPSFRHLPPVIPTEGAKRASGGISSSGFPEFDEPAAELPINDPDEFCSSPFPQATDGLPDSLTDPRVRLQHMPGPSEIVRSILGQNLNQTRCLPKVFCGLGLKRCRPGDCGIDFVNGAIDHNLTTRFQESCVALGLTRPTTIMNQIQGNHG